MCVSKQGNWFCISGYAGGSHYTKSGGAANWLCLTDEPMWGYYEENIDSAAKVNTLCIVYALKNK